ncbi:hypothetical protein MAPG_11019 [Magnaporthiopsis poae ATCC 64411]|uniref:Zn(2)-C6 fungal-type domain-containing protein n=1 Tax=Magnaporthiopsis poae (strain ATCC 64411 / 73-15) TaxID=644358 RepID=A0A0C4EE54_MAGP6|nr:hypothetical protein MAPG_11019 [Magnaporthiopsis poae ATCC 64411]
MDPDATPPIVPPPQDRSQLSLTPAAAAAEASIKRRAPIACRRCRRMRSKCVHDRKPPCDSCKAAGLGPESCIFPVRGQPDSDRDYRHPRLKAEKTGKKDPAKVRAGPSDLALAVPLGQPRLHQIVKGADAWDSLPPLNDIIDAVENFTRHYFQLGFIPKQMFTERLRQDHRSVSVFLLLSILAISARFTPSLISRYGSDGIVASETFIERASAFALNELYQPPTLERCQGFYLLSIAQQGSGWKNSSYINLGIAMRMAALMGLHREETYALSNPTKELVIAAESARRTLWMLHSQDNLHAGPSSPVSLATSDITALLPSNEDDFAKGYEPKSRAALADTPPALENPALIADSGRSLFASLIQTHYFWGKISRRAVAPQDNKCPRPWEPQSEYAQMVEKLNVWEKSLPDEHRWSSYLLKGYKVDGLDLAYLAVTMVARLCNIVLRKSYLHFIIRGNMEPRDFWADMSLELFRNVRGLYEQIDAQFKDRRPDDGTGAQITSFCVYSCGMLSAYLCKYSNICPDPAISAEGPVMLERTMAILRESQAVWPLASRWREGLEKFARDQKATVSQEGSMADGKDPVPHALQPVPSHSPVERPSTAPVADKRPVTAGPATANTPRHRTPPTKPAVASTAYRPGPQPMPDDMYLDSPMKIAAAALLPSSQNQHPQHAQQGLHHSQHNPQQQRMHSQHGQHHVSQDLQQDPAAGRGAQTGGLDLLIEASYSHHQSGTVNPPPTPYTTMGPQPTPPEPALVDYYGQNDGYTNELQFYIDGMPNNMHVWVPAGSMYGY